MTLDAGLAFSMSWKQKLVAHSSTESELIGIHNVMPQIISFVCNITQTILEQDNKSTILLATNRQASSTKCTKHIDIRYFFIKDKVDSKEITNCTLSNT
jgi:hypothetical protein